MLQHLPSVVFCKHSTLYFMQVKRTINNKVNFTVWNKTNTKGNQVSCYKMDSVFFFYFWKAKRNRRIVQLLLLTIKLLSSLLSVTVWSPMYFFISFLQKENGLFRFPNVLGEVEFCLFQDWITYVRETCTIWRKGVFLVSQFLYVSILENSDKMAREMRLWPFSQVFLKC